MGGTAAKPQLPGPKDRLAAVVRIPVDSSTAEIKYAYYPEKGEPVEQDCTLDDFLDWYNLYDDKECLVYIHGFKVNAKSAKEDTMQLREGLKFKGPMLIIDWVSVAAERADAGDLIPEKDYFADRTSVNGLAVGVVVQVLNVLSKFRGPVYFIAHSLGNQLFLNAFKEFDKQFDPETTVKPKTAVKPRFGEMFLFAPDVSWNDATGGEFAMIASLLRASRSRDSGVTVYHCSKDSALWWSEITCRDRAVNKTQESGRRHRAGLHSDQHELATVNVLCDQIRSTGKVFHTVLCDKVVRQDGGTWGSCHSYFLEPEVLFHMRSKIYPKDQLVHEKHYLQARHAKDIQGAKTIIWELKDMGDLIYDFGAGSPFGNTCSGCSRWMWWSNRGCLLCNKNYCRSCLVMHCATCTGPLKQHRKQP